MLFFKLFDGLSAFVSEGEVSDLSRSGLGRFLILLYIPLLQQPQQRPVNALSVMFCQSVDEGRPYTVSIISQCEQDFCFYSPVVNRPHSISLLCRWSAV